MRKIINVNILDIRDEQLHLAGAVYNYNEASERFFVKDEKGIEYPLDLNRAEAMDRQASETQKGRTGYYYEIVIPLRKGAIYSFYHVDLSENAQNSRKLSPKYRRFSRLTNLENSHFVYKDILICSEANSICIHRNLPHMRIARRMHFNKTLEKAPDGVAAIREKAVRMKSQSKPIWLISDRTDSAGDNGEAFFEYLITNGFDKDRNVYFLIDSTSPDYERMKKIGPVIPVGSEEHKVAFLAASMMISSAADEWVANPFGDDFEWYRDMADHPFVFLQHGIIKDDLSNWLFFLKKNVRLFITSSKPEYDSICSGSYGYDESVVKLTGLARYDKLRNEPQKKIAIMPTWRKSAAPERKAGRSDRSYFEGFRQTDYFRFYNRLINEPAILQAMKKAGYTGTFYLHPSHRLQAVDFMGNDVISVWKDITPFSQVFGENSLLVTDYSSVAFDFAYLGKPVVYAQADRAEFFATHSYTKGYFDYKKDGFGPVCDSYDETVSAIIDLIEKDCRQSELYRQRLERFYAFRDHNNCKRILDEILKLEG